MARWEANASDEQQLTVSSAPPATMTNTTWSSFLQQQALETFESAFAKVSEHKRPVCLVVEPSLEVVLERLACGRGGKAFYDQLGISQLQSLTNWLPQKKQHVTSNLTNDTHATTQRMECMVFMVPSLPKLAKTIGSIIQIHETSLALPKKRLYGVLWTPCATSECTLELEKQGLLAKTNQTSLNLGFFPLETNVLSLCDATSFEQLYFNRNQSSLSQIVSNLFALEKQTRSHFAQVICRGEFATNCHKMMLLARRVMAKEPSLDSPLPLQLQPSNTRMRFTKLVLFDRMEDPISMLLTPMTYEGLLDALVGMNHGVVKYEKQPQQQEQDASAASELFGTTRSTRSTKAILNEQDELFASLRDVNFNILISSKLQQIAQELAQEIRGYPGSTTNSSSLSSWNAAPMDPTRSLGEIQELIQKAPNLVKRKKSLALHLDLVQQIKQRSEQVALRQAVEAEMQIVCAGKNVSTSDEVDLFLEQALLGDPPLLRCDQLLKLVCLRSLLTNGFAKKKIKNKPYVTWLRQQICHAYGHNLLPVLIRLEKLGLLTQDSKAKWNFGALKRSLGLMNGIVEDEDTMDPNDVNFMFPYTGYAPMSIRMIQEGLGIKFRKSPLGMKMAALSGGSESSDAQTSGGNSNNAGGDGEEKVLVVFIGGVTVAEVAAFRLLNRQLHGKFQFVVASTSIWHASHLFKPESGDNLTL